MNRRNLPASIAAIAAMLGMSPRPAVAAPAARQERLCWNADDWEATYDTQDINLLADDMRPGDVMRTGRAVVMPDVWITMDGEGEVHEFPTEAEATAFALAVNAAEA